MQRRDVSRMCALTEKRSTLFTPARGGEVRASSAGSLFTGHAAVFDERTSIGDPRRWGWYEELDRGAFDKTLQESDARMLIDHDTSLVVARQSAGNLRLTTDKVGLATEADLNLEVSYVSDLAQNLQNRNIQGMSFGFRVVRDQWWTEEEVYESKLVTVEVRRILEVVLYEVSAVTFPAYEQTDAGLRSALEAIRADRFADTDSSPQDEAEEAPAPLVRGSEDGETPEVSTSRRNDLGVDLDEALVAARYGLR